MILIILILSLVNFLLLMGILIDVQALRRLGDTTYRLVWGTWVDRNQTYILREKQQ